MTSTPSPLGATEYATSSDGTRIAYARGGSGPVLVLVDGAFCYREFGPSERVPQALADRFTVVAWDRRGRGESGAGASTYAPEREFEDLAAVVAATGGEIVLGFSSGAALAYRTAAAGLVAPRALLGYEAPFVGRNSGKDGRPRDYRGDLEKLLAAGRNDKAVDYFMVTMVNGPAFLPLVMRLMRGPFAKLKTVAPTLLHDTDLMAGFEVPAAELARIAVPTLVLCGGKAAPAMAGAQEAIAAAIPGAEHAVLPGQMHDVKPEALLEGILPFLAERGLTPRPPRPAPERAACEDHAMLDFTTTLLATGGNNAGIELSQEQLDSLGAGKRAPVVVTIGDYSYRTTTGVMRGRFLVGVNAEHRTGAGVAAGDEIHVTIARDDAPREVEVPPALADALAADPVAAAAWEKLAYSHRKEHARAITEAKAEETHARRVAATLATLRG